MPTGNVIDPLSLNYYTYSANNPVMYCDPSGNVWENDMLSIVIPRDLHQEFTDAWRQALGYGSDYTELLKKPEELRKIITQVYENHPEILELALDYFDSLDLGDLK